MPRALIAIGVPGSSATVRATVDAIQALSDDRGLILRMLSEAFGSDAGDGLVIVVEGENVSAFAAAVESLPGTVVSNRLFLVHDYLLDK